MTESLFVFTLSGVQPFLAQARRLGDLVAGSLLMSRLAAAAAHGIQSVGGELVFPPAASLSAKGVPNTLVARVPAGAERAAGEAALAFLEREARRWADEARDELIRVGPAPDETWWKIWERQLGALWETYWAAAPLDGRGYPQTYREVRQALGACKRTRTFPQVEEAGPKDTLGGTRAALRTAGLAARDYWEAVAQCTTASRLRPGGQERLDAVGAIKRFSRQAERMPSVSTVAAAGFLARLGDGSLLARYREALEGLLRQKLYVVRDDQDWPYDGDLLYQETLTAPRLRASYGLEEPDARRLHVALEALKEVYGKTGAPSPYYGLLVLDGDGMGSRVAECRTPEEHGALSERVGRFARAAGDVVDRTGGGARLVYAGGDDVLALAPLATALPLAWEMAEAFAAEVGGSASASAGIALAHHLYPLDATLAAARHAESMAKDVEGKNAVGVVVLKRSGETLEMSSPWAPVRVTWRTLRDRLESGELASGFVGGVRDVDLLLPMQGALEAELRRLIHRHAPSRQGGQSWGPDLASGLARWAEELERSSAGSVAPWIQLARFIARGGAL